MPPRRQRSIAVCRALSRSIAAFWMTGWAILSGSSADQAVRETAERCAVGLHADRVDDAVAGHGRR